MHDNQLPQIRKKIKVLELALKNPNRWYNGYAIKRYLKTQIFSLGSTEVTNRPMASGRWSTYCHYNPVKAFENLLDKHEIGPDSHVLVHPLLPHSLVEKISERKATLLTHDIEPATLGFNPESLQTYCRMIRSTDQKIDLVIHYDLNGLYNTISESAKLLEQITIPSLVIIDNPVINAELLEVFRTISFGSVLWNAGDSFLDEQLQFVVETDIPSKPWYLSWYIETRATSLLEYHLRESHDKFEPLSYSYFALMLQKFKKEGLISLIQGLVKERIYLEKSIRDHPNLTTKLLEEYAEIWDAAIPDWVFDLQLKSPENFPGPSSFTIDDQDVYIRDTAKKVYEYFRMFIEQNSGEDLEIPPFFLNRTYLEYTIFTSKPDTWTEFFSKHSVQCYKIPEISPIIQSLKKVEQAEFVADYGLLISLPDLVQTDILEKL